MLILIIKSKNSSTVTSNVLLAGTMGGEEAVVMLAIDI